MPCKSGRKHLSIIRNSECGIKGCDAFVLPQSLRDSSLKEGARRAFLAEEGGFSEGKDGWSSHRNLHPSFHIKKGPSSECPFLSIIQLLPLQPLLLLRELPQQLPQQLPLLPLQLLLRARGVRGLKGLRASCRSRFQ